MLAKLLISVFMEKQGSGQLFLSLFVFSNRILGGDHRCVLVVSNIPFDMLLHCPVEPRATSSHTLFEIPSHLTRTFNYKGALMSTCNQWSSRPLLMSQESGL